MVEIKVDDAKLRKALDRIGERVNDLSPLMHDLSLYMRRSVMKNFDLEGRTEMGTGHAWKPLAKRTIKERQEKKGKGFGRHPILELTGDLRRSISISHGRREARVSAGKEYGITHQFGTKRVPARPFLMFPITDIDVWVRHIIRYFKERVFI